jgi:hypothetical protein
MSATSPKAVSPVGLPSEMTVAQLLGALKPAQLWSTFGALAAALAGIRARCKALPIGIGAVPNPSIEWDKKEAGSDLQYLI